MERLVQGIFKGWGKRERARKGERMGDTSVELWDNFLLILYNARGIMNAGVSWCRQDMIRFTVNVR